MTLELSSQQQQLLRLRAVSAVVSSPLRLPHRYDANTTTTPPHLPLSSLSFISSVTTFECTTARRSSCKHSKPRIYEWRAKKECGLTFNQSRNQPQSPQRSITTILTVSFLLFLRNLVGTGVRAILWSRNIRSVYREDVVG